MCKHPLISADTKGLVTVFCLEFHPEVELTSWRPSGLSLGAIPSSALSLRPVDTGWFQKLKLKQHKAVSTHTFSFINGVAAFVATLAKVYCPGHPSPAAPFPRKSLPPSKEESGSTRPLRAMLGHPACVHSGE